MVDFWRKFWIRETGTGEQVAQLQDRYDDDDDDDDDDGKILRNTIMNGNIDNFLYISIKMKNKRRWKGQIKIMFTLEQATKAQKGSRVIALLFL